VLSELRKAGLTGLRAGDAIALAREKEFEAFANF
jgi:hypothetical protein